MKPTQILMLAIAGAVLGALVGVGWQQWQEHYGDSAARHGAELSRLPAFSYPGLDGSVQDSTQWAGRTLVLNFWATWCPPCREETPLFVELQETYGAAGVQFVGIAIDDLQPTQDFADTYGVNYPILIGDSSAIELSRKLGNRFEGLPYTVIAAPDGKVTLRHMGGLEREQIEPELQRLTAPKP